LAVSTAAVVEVLKQLLRFALRALDVGFMMDKTKMWRGYYRVRQLPPLAIILHSSIFFLL